MLHSGSIGKRYTGANASVSNNDDGRNDKSFLPIAEGIFDAFSAEGAHHLFTFGVVGVRGVEQFKTETLFAIYQL